MTIQYFDTIFDKSEYKSACHYRHHELCKNKNKSCKCPCHKNINIT